MRAALLFILFGISTLVNAGSIVGNGADVVVCKDPLNGEVKSVELLDFYESRDLDPMDQPYFGDNPELSVHDMVQLILVRLAAKIPEMSARLNEYALHYETSYQLTVELPDVSDATVPKLPAHCDLKQLILQIGNYREKLYLIDEVLYKRLDKTNRAIAELHEAVYRLAMRLGASNSNDTREFVRYMVSKRLMSDSSEQVKTRIQSHQLQYMIYDVTWQDPQTGAAWKLDETGQDLFVDCQAAWGEGYHQATIDELKDHFATIEPHFYGYMYANGRREVSIFSSSLAEHTDDCLASGENQVWTIRAKRSPTVQFFSDSQCLEATRDFAFCVRGL